MEPKLIQLSLKQEGSLSLILFNIVLEKLIREMHIGPREGMNQHKSTIGL